MIRISRGIVRIVKKMGERYDDYRFYVIARHHCANRSGIFSLDEFADILQRHYLYDSLHHRPGNNRNRFKRRIARLMDESFLFTRLPDGRYRANSERRIMNKYDRRARNSWYHLSDSAILASRQAFFDFCVGTLLSGNKFRANKKIAGYCGCTVRRIQYATSRNHKGETFTKQYNFVEDFSGTYEEVLKFRAMLFNEHGISSPLPKKRGKVWVLRINAPNSYSSNVLSGVKGDRIWQQTLQAQPTVRQNRKEDCWFFPVPLKNTQLKLIQDSIRTKRWYFNTPVYNLGCYVTDHSRLLT